MNWKNYCIDEGKESFTCKVTDGIHLKIGHYNEKWFAALIIKMDQHYIDTTSWCTSIMVDTIEEAKQTCIDFTNRLLYNTGNLPEETQMEELVIKLQKNQKSNEENLSYYMSVLNNNNE